MLVFVSCTKASPLCVARDGVSTFNYLVCDDVVMRSDCERPQEPPLEERYKVVRVLLSLGMQQIAKERVIRACCELLVSCPVSNNPLWHLTSCTHRCYLIGVGFCASADRHVCTVDGEAD
jgi:hypothetical protein